MKHIYRIFLFLVLISVCTTTTAHSDTATPDIIYSELPFLNQLPTKEITTLYQDSEGFVWIGTADGLGRYDGYDTKIFRSDYNNPSALTSNYIKSISETEQYICIGTREGLNLIDKKTLSISKPNHDEIRDREIHSMVKDQAGNLYVSAENAIYKYDASLKSVCKLIIDAEKRKTATGLFTDDNNVLWAMVWGGGLYRYDEGREIFEKMPKIGEKDNPIKMIQDHDGRYWVCT